MVGSNSAKEDLIKFGIPSINITIVPHGVMLPKLIPKHQITNPKMITYFGPLTPDKGIMNAISVFNILNKKEIISFAIGRPETDEYYKKVMDSIERFGLLDKIEFWKYSDEEKFEILSKSYVLINPSIREGWVVNIEANLVGTPVIAYPSQGLVDSVKHGVSGILTKSSTPENLASEIERLTSNRDEYAKLVEGSKKWASNFNWENQEK